MTYFLALWRKWGNAWKNKEITNIADSNRDISIYGFISKLYNIFNVAHRRKNERIHNGPSVTDIRDRRRLVNRDHHLPVTIQGDQKILPNGKVESVFWSQGIL